MIGVVYTGGLHRSNLHREAAEARIAQMYSPYRSVMGMMYTPDCPVLRMTLSEIQRLVSEDVLTG